MNRIYKVVWSRARACYVVVSEYAKRTGKSASTKKLLIALAAAGIMAGGAGMADAAVNASGEKVTMTEDDAKALNALIGKAATLAPTAAKKGESGSARITITDGGKAIPTDWTIDTTYATSGTAYAESSIHTSTGIAANDHSKMKTDSGYAAKQGTNNLSLGYYTNAGYGLAVEMESEKDADGNETLVVKKDKYGRVTYITEKTGNRRYAYQYDSDKQYNYATALGFYTAATNELATAWGWYSVASGCGSTAWGYYTVASGKYATAFGYKTTAMGENSLAIGEYSIASGKDSFAGGRGTKYYSTLASGDGAFAYGYLATASGEDSSALNEGNASGSSAAAFNKGIAKGDYSAAFNQSKASGENSVSFNNSTAEGESAAAFGGASTASGKYSLAAGYGTTASAKESVALGLSTKATKEAAFAGGQQSEANGVASFAFGNIAKTGEYASSAISMGNQTEANGSASVALGDQSKAYGKSSLAIGVESIAKANYSNAIGGGITLVEAEVDPDTGETVVDPDTGEIKYKYNATWSTAIGYDAKTYQADSMALGVYSRAYNEGSTALGYEAKAKVDYGTAIGAWSIADRDKYSVAYADNQKTPYGYDKREATDDETVWKSTGAAIAVGGTKTLYDDNDNVIGKETITRQITGVAAGTELTDAVNVAQLKAVEKDAAKHSKVAAGKNLTVTDDSATATDGVTYTVALNDAISVTSVTAGTSSLTADTLKIGGNTYISAAGISANNRKITNVANGTADTDAVNYSQLKAISDSLKNTVAIVYVNDDKTKSIKSTNAGSVGTNSIAVGNGASASDRSVAIGDGTAVNGKTDSTAIGYMARTGLKGVSIGSNVNQNTAANGGDLTVREGTVVVGSNSAARALYSTVVGTDSVISVNSKVDDYVLFGKHLNLQGAGSVVTGAYNTVNTGGDKYYGISTNISGTGNTVTASNGITIQGSGNTVTNAYQESSNFNILDAYTAYKTGDYAALIKSVSQADSGAIAIIGGTNTVSDQISSSVIGYKNTLKGSTDAVADSVFLAGYKNTLTNVSDAIIMGVENTVSDKENVISLGNKNTINESHAVALGHGAKINTGAANSVALGENSEADAAVSTASLTINDKNYTFAGGTAAGTVSVGKSGAERTITNVAAGRISGTSTDAVNGSQLYAVTQALSEVDAKAGKHSIVKKADGEQNITLESSTTDGQTTYTVGLANDLKDINSVSNGSGTSKVVLNDGYAGIAYGDTSVLLMNGQVVLNGQVNVLSDGTIRGVKAGVNDTDAVNVGQLKKAISEGVAAGNTDTHIDASKTYKVDDTNKISLDVVDKDGTKTGTVTIEGVAKSDDLGNVDNFNEGVKNKDGSPTTVVDAINNIDGRVTNIENSITEVSKKHSSVKAGSNIKVTEGANTAGGKEYTVALDTDITVDSVTAGKTKISDDGVAYDGMTYIGKDGLNANGQKITNVADGTAAGDAVNYGQLSAVEKKVDNNTIAINNLSGSVNKLGNRINRVGAGAAALAALHPLDFDPEAKWDFAAGYGNYRGANAAAVGAFYRPNEDWMLSFGGSFGGGENMVNAGVSLKVGAGSSNTGTSKAAMAKEIRDLKDVVADQSAEIEELKALVNSLIEANKAK